MKLVTAPAFVLLALVAASAWALNTQFLKETPYAKFSKEDKRLLMQSIDKALAESGDGQTTEWKNEVSGASGALTPQKSFERDGRKCREMEVRNRYKTLHGQGNFTFCQDKAGKWQLAQ
jgi:surface antigen